MHSSCNTKNMGETLKLGPKLRARPYQRVGGKGWKSWRLDSDQLPLTQEDNDSPSASRSGKRYPASSRLEIITWPKPTQSQKSGSMSYPTPYQTQASRIGPLPIESGILAPQKFYTPILGILTPFKTEFHLFRRSIQHASRILVPPWSEQQTSR